MNIDYMLYIENRNGNASAKTAQKEILERMFFMLQQNGVPFITNFRADAASCQEQVFTLLGKYVENIYISAPSSCVKRHFNKIEEWIPFNDGKGGEWLIGETTFTPFTKKN